MLAYYDNLISYDKLIDGLDEEPLKKKKQKTDYSGTHPLDALTLYLGCEAINENVTVHFPRYNWICYPESAERIHIGYIASNNYRTGWLLPRK